ncbi:MAG: type II secretion system F family protein [Actinomycetia bacterium]|nr:type II secretion system F family protein [Actinomycetes bacterium]
MIWAAVLAAVAVGFCLRAPSLARLRRLRAEAVEPSGLVARLRETDLLTSPWIAAVGSVVMVTQFVSGWTGVVIGAGVSIAVFKWVSGLETVAMRRRRQQTVRDLPLAVDLLVAALAAGRPPGHAIAAVGKAVGGPLGQDFAAIAARIELGADPDTVWRDASEDPVLAPVGRSFRRASRSGASITTVLERCVDDLRRRRHTAASGVARSAGVRTAAPLGLCFLPAFIAVGVVPTVVGAFWNLVL